MIERGTIFCDNNMAEVKIIGFGEGIPKRCVSNDALTTLVDTNDEWIRSRTGIQQRYIATDETLTDLCTQAAQNALRQAGITAEQLDRLTAFLCSGTKDTTNLILRHEADRIHTLIPGMLILQHAFHLFSAQQLIVGKYGVREGYLCQKILYANTLTPKTEN